MTRKCVHVLNTISTEGVHIYCLSSCISGRQTL